MAKPGLSDNEQKIHEGLLGILQERIIEGGGILAILYATQQAKVDAKLAELVDQLQDKDDK